MVKRIGVLTSGGDAPGMNAAIRGVVRSTLFKNKEVFGIYDGYQGLYDNQIQQLNRYSVSDIINRGGTILGSARFPEFIQKENRARAIKNLNSHGIDALVVIGGDGSYAGAQLLAKEGGIHCVGLPGTIDNDVAGTDYSIGFFTALQTVVEAIDRLRDTSSSHQRISIVEVMGRHCGDLTLAAAIAGGCEFIVIPEVPFDRKELITEIKAGIAKGKKHAIITITERICDINELSQYIEKETKRETRPTVLGHIQRGGAPVAYDRILASRMGAYAVELLVQNDHKAILSCCVGVQNGKMRHAPISECISIDNKRQKFKEDWLDVANTLF